MKKIISTLFCFLTFAISSDAQIIFSEEFESVTFPVDWQNISDATDGGWRFGASETLSSQYFGIASNGTRIAATNDDNCNCDKSNDLLITKPIDLSNETSAVLKFDLYFGNELFQGAQENATVEISLDGVNWIILDDLHGHGGWDQHIIDISEYVGNETIYIGFKYNDGGGWLYGMALDNVIIEVPNNLDVALVDLERKTFGEIGKEFRIAGTILNNGLEAITSMEVQYIIGTDAPVVEVFDNLDIKAFEYSTFKFSNGWTPSVEGSVEIQIEILSVNDTMDDIADNNSDSFSTEIYGEVVVPNKIEEIVFSDPIIKTIAGFSNGLDRPTDLDFFPVLGRDELWVINQRTENAGGSTVTISDATADTPSNMEMKVDGNSWHFMSLPTGIAFSDDNFNFANSTGVQDANHNGGTFTGPALWSSDPEIYAQPSGGNGSHLDMLHGSPFCMGIAHEVDNVFWVYDDWNKDIVRYDFADDHGPGNDDHADGRLRRYQNIGIQKDLDIPSHMILDKSTGWMYFVDNGNSRVMRLDINSGSVGSSLPTTNEPLAEHSAMIDFTVETIIEEGLDRPCGIEYFDGYLLVGNYGSGTINVYDVENDFTLVGEIRTGDVGLTGIKIGPDGNIYAVNRIQNSLVAISEGLPTSTVEYQPGSEIKVYPNPASNYINIDINNSPENSISSIKIYNNQGQIVLNQLMNQEDRIDVSRFNNGIYILEAAGPELLYKKKFSIIK